MLSRKARAGSVLLALVCLLLTEGCGLMQQPQTYMRLPKLLAEEEKLMEQVQLTLPKGAAIIRPRKSDQTNTVPILDLDGDGVEEAVLFYKNKGDMDQIIGEIWTKTALSWKRLTTIPGEGMELDTLKFVDLTQSGKPNIVVGFAAANKSDQRGLTVYTLEAHAQLSKQFEMPYQEMVIDDLNADGREDITIITRVRGKDKDMANAVLYQYAGKFEELGRAGLDPYINGYYNVAAGNVAAGRRGIVLDSQIGAHSSNTQLLVWDAGQLKAAFPDNASPTTRAYSANSSDVDGDGIIEIPLMNIPQGWENEAMVNILWQYPFYKWDGKSGLVFVLERFYNVGQGFYVDIPKEWLKQYTLEKTEQSIRFVRIGSRELLAEIKFTPLETWKQSDSGWVELTRTGTTVYEVDAAAESFGRSMFHLITETPAEEEATP